MRCPTFLVRFDSPQILADIVDDEKLKTEEREEGDDRADDDGDERSCCRVSCVRA